MRDYQNAFEGKPDVTSEVDIQKIPNKGLIVFEEKLGVDPETSEETMRLTHRGGLVSHRTEHY